jgi:hypothetical protein
MYLGFTQEELKQKMLEAAATQADHEAGSKDSSPSKVLESAKVYRLCFLSVV